jgi:prepilin-type N-terminal cleavage/methylation domain-containing protein
MRRFDLRSARLRSGDRGFTLIEIIMVLLILGVLSYFATSRLFTDDVLSRISEVDLIKSHLRYAQSRAMNSEGSWGIKFGSSTRYWLYKEPSDSTIIRLPEVESTDGAVHLTATQVSWSSPATEKVTFDSFGSPGGSTLTYTIQPKEGGSAVGQIMISKNTGFIP